MLDGRRPLVCSRIMRGWTSSVFLLLSILLLAPCGVEASTSTPQIHGPLSVGEIFEEPARYEGQVVMLRGIFQGWRTEGCRFPSSASRRITRSDWLIRTETDCLYVTGGRPASLDPMFPGDVGRRIELKAIVARHEAGGLYLRYLDAHSLGE